MVHSLHDTKMPIFEPQVPQAIGQLTRPPKSLKITCLTIGTRGDVQPYIALCRRLNELGHTCTIATHKNFRHWIESNGIFFAEIEGDPEQLMEHCVQYGVLSPFFWWNGFSRFSPWFDGLLTSSWKACQGSDILIESPSALIGVHIAQSLNIPYYRAFTMPWTKTGAYFHAMLALSDTWGSWLNRMSYILFDLLIWIILARRINTWRESVLGLKSTTFSQLRLDQVPFLYNFSPLVVPRPNDWQPWVNVTGYWFLNSPDENESSEKSPENSIPEDLRKVIHQAKESGRKIVYVGFGSVIVPDLEKNMDAIIGAVKESNVFAIVSGGWTAQQAEREYASTALRVDVNHHSDCMYYVDSIPHDWLFAQVDVALHHGGAGTTAASIRAGIPTIIKPFFGDQHFWARRVEQLGIGTHVTTFEKHDILHAIQRATTDQNQIRNARLLGEKIRRENGVDNAIKVIYKYLDYSQCLIETTRSLRSPLQPSQFSHMTSAVKSAISSTVKTFYFPRPATNLRSISNGYNSLV